MRWLVLAVAATLFAAGGAALGYAVRDTGPEIVRTPVPGPTKTVVKTKTVRVDRVPRLELVPPRTPLSLQARGGRIPRRTALVPRKARVEKLERVRAAAGVPRQVVVSWRKESSGVARGLGLLLWELDDEEGRARWRVVFGINEANLGCNGYRSYSVRSFSRRALEFGCRRLDGVLVGPPSKEWKEPLFCGMVGPFLGFELHDLTGDGHDDVFVSEGGCGSGGGTTWRVLASGPEGTNEIFRHVGGDTIMRLVDGTIRVRAAVHRRGDSHCCPSFFRRYTLAWDGTRFTRTDVGLTKARF